MESEKGFDMKSRNKRPPRDPVNAMLSYGYMLLVRDFNAAIIAAGLDPMLGFYHNFIYPDTLGCKITHS